MDMQMPHINGLEATRQIRLLPEGAAIPIIAMTANAFAEDRELCIEAGMNDFIAKPVSVSLLYQKLCAWLQKRWRGKHQVFKIIFLNYTAFKGRYLLMKQLCMG